MINASEWSLCDMRGLCDMNRGAFAALRIVSDYTACFMSDITAILATGGTGPVGATLARRLAASRYRVRTLGYSPALRIERRHRACDGGSRITRLKAPGRTAAGSVGVFSCRF